MTHPHLPAPLVSSYLSLARMPPPIILLILKILWPTPFLMPFFSPSKHILGSMIHHCNCSLPCTKSISCLYPPSLYSGQTPVLVTFNAQPFCSCTVEYAWSGSHTRPDDRSHFKSWPLTASEPSLRPGIPLHFPSLLFSSSKWLLFPISSLSKLPTLLPIITLKCEPRFLRKQKQSDENFYKLSP